MMDWTPGVTIEIAEQMCIQQAFQFYRNNKTATANALGISIRTLDAKLEKYEADDNDKRLAADRQRIEREHQLARARASNFVLQSSISGAAPRPSVEPAAQAATEPQVSVQERPQVQEVLQRQTAQSGAKRAR